MNNRTHIYLDKSLSKEANWLVPALSTAGTMVAHGAAGHLVQNQISKKIMHSESQLNMYHNSFLAGVQGHQDFPVKHQVALGVISPEVGILHAQANDLGKKLKAHLDKSGLGWDTNLPQHHYDYAHAMVTGSTAAADKIKAVHKDVDYIHEALHSSYPQINQLYDPKVADKFKNSTIGKVLNRLVEKPKVKELPVQVSPLRQKLRNAAGYAAEAGATAALAYKEPVTAAVNVIKRGAGITFDPKKHPLINKIQDAINNKTLYNPVAAAYASGKEGHKLSKAHIWAHTNIINPLVGETSDLANIAGNVKTLAAKKKQELKQIIPTAKTWVKANVGDQLKEVWNEAKRRNFQGRDATIRANAKTEEFDVNTYKRETRNRLAKRPRFNWNIYKQEARARLDARPPGDYSRFEKAKNKG
jgi:hypothetical protein